MAEGAAIGRDAADVPLPGAEDGVPPRRWSLAGLIVTAAALSLAAVVGIVLAFQFVDAERERELKRWQVRLGIVADSRVAEVEKWLEAQFAELASLAENASLQLYMSVLEDAPGGGAGASAGENAVEAAEAGYLRNLLSATAARAGFWTPAPGPVRANVERPGSAGLALLDRDDRVLVASAGLLPVDGTLARFVGRAPRGERSASAIFAGPAGTPMMAFLAPVYSDREEVSPASQIGWVLGVREVERALFPLLQQPGAVSETAEAVLVQRQGGTIVYLSPLADGKGPRSMQMAADTPNLAAAFAVATPGGFALRSDYAGREVLVTSRAVAGMPWTLMYKVDRIEALGESEERLGQLIAILLMIIAVVLIAMVAIWYHGASRRAGEAAGRFRSLARRFEEQRDFMRLVSDSQPSQIAIFDADGRYRWFNEAAARFAGLDRADLLGKPVASVLGPVAGKRLTAWIRECLDRRAPLAHDHVMDVADRGEAVFHAAFIPLPQREGRPLQVLMVAQDMTEMIRERTRRERTMRQLVSALVGVVDRRDPYSAHHSTRVGRVARAIAREMEREEDLGETVEIAGSLLNLGKIAVPEAVLTKQGALTEAEMQMIRDSVLASAELVANIDFDGPVTETLRQLQEHFDGSGLPKGLAGDSILMSARIVAVANAFVAMVSARAYRAGMPFDRAAATLMEQCDKAFDRRCVAALVNYLENRGGREEWRDFGAMPQAAGA